MGNNGKIGFRFLFITQDDPFYVKLFFQEFFNLYTSLEEVWGVVIARAMNQETSFALAHQMYDFYGPVDFVRMGVRYVGARLLERTPIYLKPKRHHSLRELCRAHGIGVRNDIEINEKAFLEEVRRADLDLIISVASSVIFRGELIGAPKHGCINLHNGKLPKYRGMMPSFWQMYHGEPFVGITIHEMNQRIDDGRIILQKEVGIDPDETLDSLMRRTKKVSAQCMMEAINRIKSGNVKYLENPAKEGSYFSFPLKRDAREFRRRGKRIL